MKFEVLLLENVEKFILKLSIKMQAKVQRTIELLEEFGFSLTIPHSKIIKGIKNLKELRIKLGSNICRLFYFHYKNQTYIITSGYIKKETKLNKTEIKKADLLMQNILTELSNEK
jgi:hypothetical protein